MTARNEGARGDVRKAREAAQLDESITQLEGRGDVSALSEVVHGLSDDIAQMLGIDPTNPLDIAAAFLTSDWLADHVRTAVEHARADERERIAAAIEADAAEFCEGCDTCDGNMRFGLNIAADIARSHASDEAES